MADSRVIADVSQTLENVLTEGLKDLPGTPAAVLHDLQGTIAPPPPQLTLFLFEVIEDPGTRNRPRRRTTTPEMTLAKPPMALLLRYLITPWSGDRVTDHQVLGRALQVLYDQAILSGPQLMGQLAGSDQALKITLEPLTLEELTRVWYSVQKPYRLSVVYEVRVVNLDPETKRRLQPVTRRTLDFASPEAGA